MPPPQAELETLFKDKSHHRRSQRPGASLHHPERNRAIVREFRQVLDKGYLDSKGVLRKPLLGKTIVFAVTKRHAETLASCSTTSSPTRSPPPKCATPITWSPAWVPTTPPTAWQDPRFKKEPFPQILVSVNMLDTGFDCPKWSTWSLRASPSSHPLPADARPGHPQVRNKPVFTMFDFVGVTDYHGDDDDYAEGGMVMEPPKPRPRKNTTRRCCHWTGRPHRPHTRAWITVDETATWSSPKPPSKRPPNWAPASRPGYWRRRDLTPGRNAGCA
jgi:type I restriction enzyme R subunit